SVQNWARDPTALVAQFAPAPVKLSHESIVLAGELGTAERPLRVALKRYRPKNLVKWIAGLVRRDRAAVGFARGHALLARGIATARPLAAIGDRLQGESYLLTEWIE